MRRGFRLCRSMIAGRVSIGLQVEARRFFVAVVRARP